MIVGKWVELKPNEKRRTYLYLDCKIESKNITALYISESETHYLECSDGKVIVKPGWVAISIDVDKWTYPKRE